MKREFEPPRHLKEGEAHFFDVSGVDGIVSAMAIDHTADKDLAVPDGMCEFCCPTAGRLEIKLNNGAVLRVWTSEWGGVDYLPPKAAN